jgi:hypothetical protein
LPLKIKRLSVRLYRGGCLYVYYALGASEGLKMGYLKNLNSDQISTLLAVCALIVSFLSIILILIALWLQRRHYFKALTTSRIFL